jgi:hypothetical protein
MLPVGMARKKSRQKGGKKLKEVVRAQLRKRAPSLLGIINNVVGNVGFAQKNPYKGAKHAIFNKNGKLVRANFAGPGTHIVESVMTGVKPVNTTDKGAQAHDIRYNLKTGERDADRRLINALKKSLKEGTDDPENIYAVMRPIQLKMAAENLGVLKKGRFYDEQEPMTETQKKALEAKLAELQQEGFGAQARHWHEHGYRLGYADAMKERL